MTQNDTGVLLNIAIDRLQRKIRYAKDVGVPDVVFDRDDAEGLLIDLQIVRRAISSVSDAAGEERKEQGRSIDTVEEAREAHNAAIRDLVQVVRYNGHISTEDAAWVKARKTLDALILAASERERVEEVIKDKAVARHAPPQPGRCAADQRGDDRNRSKL